MKCHYLDTQLWPGTAEKQLCFFLGAVVYFMLPATTFFMF